MKKSIFKNARLSLVLSKKNRLNEPIMPEGKNIATMFGKIAKRYDLTNRFLSLGLDRYWRWRIVQALKAAKAQTIIDMATGSGEVAFALQKGLGPQAKIIGIDFCKAMLQEAIIKKKKKALYRSIQFVEGDCLNPPLEDHSADGITIAFGLRNFEDRTQGLNAMKQLLKPGGTLVILEASHPYRGLKTLYYFYLKYIMPRLALAITGDASAYYYLADSIASFPTAQALAKELKEIGFQSVQTKRLSLGIVALHIAKN